MIRQISADELTTMRELDLPLELLDLRSVSEFVQGSVEEAMNLRTHRSRRSDQRCFREEFSGWIPGIRCEFTRRKSRCSRL